MATLEKIRNRSALLIAVIGLGLLAFILGDAFSSSRSFLGIGSTLAKVNGQKIDIQDFQAKYNEMSEGRNNADVDPSALQQEVLDQMINEKLLEKAYKDLGINVSDAFLSDLLIGKYADRGPAAQLAQQAGAASPAELHDMIFNPAKYQLTAEQVAPLRAQWLEIEDEAAQSIKQQLMQNLLDGALQANDIDREAVRAESNIYKVTLAKKDLTAIDASKIEVSDAEIQALYNKEKNQHRLSAEVRKVSFITVDVVPSQKDRADADTLFNKVVADLRVSEGVEAANQNGEVNVEEQTVLLSKLNNQARKDFLASAAPGAVSPIERTGDNLSVVKLLNTKTEVDSLRVEMVLAPGKKSAQDSILAMLNAGTPIDEIKKTFKDVEANPEAAWLNVMNVNPTEKEAKDKLLAAGSEYFILVGNDETGAQIARVVERKAPKTQYEIAIVSYKVLPSETTKNALLDQLQEFINKNNTAEAFQKNAAAAGYQAVESFITADMSQLGFVPDLGAAERYSRRLAGVNGGINNTRRAIQWAFKANKGQVSPIFDKENKDKYFAIALADITPKGLVPVTDASLRQELTAKVRKEKAAEQLVKQYAGKASDIAGYATAMQVQTDTTTVNFGSSMIERLGRDAKLAGIVAGAQQGKLVGPVAGDNGVYVFTLNGVDADGPKLSDEQAGQRARQFGAIAARNFVTIMRQKATIDNNIGKFYNNQD